MTIIYFALFYLFIVTNKTKVFRVCELYYELKHLGMDPFKGIYSEEYVCMADYSSRLDTLYYENTRGIPRYGIFQLSGIEWCDNGRHKSENKCNTSCDNFLDDDVTDDALCVKKVVESTMDMSAWPVFKKYCTKQVTFRYFRQCLFAWAKHSLQLTNKSKAMVPTAKNRSSVVHG
ncbi:lysozyme C, milk isozyme-like [Pogona vitticeps]